MKKIILTVFFIAFYSRSSYVNDYRLFACLKLPNHGVILQWTTKCGSTKIKTGLLQNELCSSHLIEEYKKKTGKKGSEHDIIKLAQKEFPTKKEDVYNTKYTKIKFVRSPYTRAVSSYTNGIRARQYNISFHEFLIHIKQKSWHKLHPSKKALQYLLGHTRPQNSLFDFHAKIIHIENILEIEDINKEYNLSINLITKNCDHETIYTKNQQKYCGNYIFKKTYNQEYPEGKVIVPYYIYFYSKETLQLVEEIYREDILRYGYTRPQEITDFINQQYLENLSNNI